MNARMMLTAMRDSLESVPLMMMDKLLTVNIVSPMVSTMSVNQVVKQRLLMMSYNLSLRLQV